jgi:hypothetical protein
MALRGANVRRGANVADNAQSIAPTILHVLGVPISRELPRPVKLEVFDDAFARRYPLRFVQTYGRPRQPDAVSEGTPLDQEMIDRLRSLGYVK